ncbi:unnamed protein product, partial [Ascophyllum nodosum]
QRLLGGCLFEQKWIDLSCGELCEQMVVTCLPHGKLLQEIRRRSASVFNSLHGLYSDLLWVLDRCVASLLRGRIERDKAEEKWIRKLANTRTDHEARTKAIQESREFEQEEQARAKSEAKFQVVRMGDTLRTLNGIFKTMQEDWKTMAEIDLKDRCRVLEQEVLSWKKEAKEFHALKKKHLEIEAEMQVLKTEFANSKLREARVKEEMEQHQSLVQELMDNEARRLIEIEALKAGTDTVVEGSEDGSGRGDEDDDEEGYKEEIGSSVLCIKCRKALDDLGNIADALEKERQLKGEVRLQCHGYRLLLPNLKGYRPPRTVAWVRTVMRAVLRAKIWDDSVLRYKQDLRVRFPEFAYSWFEPSKASMATANAIERSKLVAQANDDRWGLYYGAKALARENAEATIFWHVLNETNGEDYLTFLVYCLSVIEGTAGRILREQWGINDTCTDLHTLKRKVDAVANEVLSSGRDVVWLLSNDAVEAVNHVLVKALEDQKWKVLEATKAISVSCEGRLPDQDPFSTCVDLFLFLRIMLHSFKEEQVNRRAAVRLMFETATTGVLTDDTPIYGDSVLDQNTPSVAETTYSSLLRERKVIVDLPQFMVITRTLWPEVTTSDAVTLFRDAHEETNGEVDYETFLKLADRWQFFSNALQLPVHMPSRSDVGRPGLDVATKGYLGALVHRHYNLMQPAVENVKETLPESAVKQLEIQPQEASSSSMSIDGTRPLAAYRRLLAIMFHVRNVRHESGPGYELPTGKGAHVVQKTEAEFRAFEAVFFDLKIDSRFRIYERIRERLAAVRVQRAWRRKLSRSCEVPLAMLELFRPGFLRGSGETISRVVHHPPHWVQQQVAEVYTAKLRSE